MRQNTPEDANARTALPRFSIDDFECELPPEVRSELVAPRRPPTPVRPLKERHDWRGFVLACLVLVLAAGVLIALWSWQRQFEKLAAAPVLPAPALQPASSPPVARAYAQEMPVVPRAERVLRLGRWNQVWMPDGELTWARFLGVKDTFSDLPTTPQMGDAWGVREGGQQALWVWHVLPGHVRAAWVDP
jgi:hypothetical protein